MCGIAGYSVGIESQIDRTLATQALLAGIAERGADAVGYAVRGDGPLTVHKQQTGASAITRRGIRRSPPTTTPSATGASSASTTGSSRTTKSFSPATTSSGTSRR